MSVLLLVDVDNVVGGNNPRPELVEVCLVELIARPPGRAARPGPSCRRGKGPRQVATAASRQDQSHPKSSIGEAVPTVDDEVAIRIGAEPEVMRRLTRSARRLERVGWLLSWRMHCCPARSGSWSSI
ncbi:hypothetical protein [Actinoalloteichus fjordicus]|uniref:hypothetical protein n=1 Tax=Actinoalloteichus fjordicus TaxID=1612552 RepID=UPI0009531638|nr:hypothetical protein [Actinoalloteichus fjordicus]